MVTAFLLTILCMLGTSSAQFFMPWYLNETKELMDLDIAIVKGMNKPSTKSQIRQVIHDTYEFYSKLEDVCYMIESYDDTGFRIYDEFMHKDQVSLLKMGPHCIAVDYNETELVQKYNWTEANVTELMMNVRGILYSWHRLEQLRNTVIITTTTTTSTTTTPEPPTTTSNNTDSETTRKLKGITRSPHPSGKTRGTYKKRAPKLNTVKKSSPHTKNNDTGQNSTVTTKPENDRHKRNPSREHISKDNKKDW